jgi:hypothetical protein
LVRLGRNGGGWLPHYFHAHVLECHVRCLRSGVFTMQHSLSFFSFCAGLRVGSRIDARLALTGAWLPARIVSIAPSPFSHWYRVAFDGLGLEWWRWISWEGPGPFCNGAQSTGDSQVEPFTPYLAKGRSVAAPRTPFTPPSRTLEVLCAVDCSPCGCKT